MIALSIDSFVPRIVEAVRLSRAVVVTAAPGAGKTTRVPPSLVADGPVILLQPRRIAARAIAQRIAGERHWTIGREIGWQVRFDRRFGPATRLLVATEGILTARLQQDPLLSSFNTIVLDEFHERSLHVDLAVALAKQAWRARADLRIVVMSATLDAAAVSSFLGGCPVIEVPGLRHPLRIDYAPGQLMAAAAREVLHETSGDVLCFLPGAVEIRRAISELTPAVGGDIALVPLYGTLDAADQDRALDSAPGQRRIVVSTNIAETSLTVPGVTAVVDSGFHKVARYDADRGIDSLTTERISQDSADQRAGRAARLGPGVVRRLWDARDRLRPHRDAEIHRVDLASAVLDVIAWGGDPRTLDWFDPPRSEALDAAFGLLERLGALSSGRLTGVGRQVQRLPIHPRLARMLIAAAGSRTMARACALLSERQFIATGSASTSSDLLSAVDDWHRVPPHVDRVAREIERLVPVGVSGAREAAGRSPGRESDSDFRRAILAGYPDRVAQRRDRSSRRVRLATGAGGVLGSQSGVRDGEFLVALDVQASTRSSEPDSLIRVASQVDREWLSPTSVEVQHRFEPQDGFVRAFEVESYDALILAERPVPVDPGIAGALLAQQWLKRGPRDSDARILARLRFAGQSIDLPSAAQAAAYDKRSLDAISLEQSLPAELLRTLTRDAPEIIRVPSGRSVPLEYRDDGTVMASVKLQELFGLAETPKIGPNREPLLIALLAPNGRPVQMTRDLRSFWENTYPEIRKELRGRYPRHPWPEDPWRAAPTARTIRKAP